MAEAGGDGLGGDLLGEAGQLLGGLDHQRQIIVVEVTDTRPAHRAEGEDPVAVGRLRLDQTVRRHHDRAGERGEVTLLVLPGPAVVTGQVGVLVQFRVAVGGQHLAVGVDVDAGAGGGLQDLGQVVQVVTGDQDRLADHRGDPHRGGHRGPEAAGVGGVEHLHHLEVDRTQLQGVAQQRVGLGGSGGQEGQAGLDAGVGVVGAVAQGVRVVGVGGHPLEAVEVEVAQADDIGAQGVQVGVDTDPLGLLDDLGDLVGRLELGCAGEDFGLLAGGTGGGLIGLPGLLAHADGLSDHRHEAGGVEVDVGQRGEQVECGVRGEARIGGAEFPQLLRVLTDTEVDLHQNVLQCGGGGVLTAVALRRRAAEAQQVRTVGLGGAVGLLALVAKHSALLLIGHFLTLRP